MSRPCPRHVVLLLSAVALATACSSSSSAPAPAPAPRLAVFVTTDEHSHLFAGSPERDDHPLRHAAGAGTIKGGVARRHALLQAERAAAAAKGIDTLTVSAGDFSQGTLAGVPFSVSAPELVLMARMGYDAVAIGNHEFDLGISSLSAAIKAGLARAPGGKLPPLLLSNVTFPATPGTAEASLRALFGERGSGKPVVRSAVVTTAGGHKVGLISDLGPAAAYVAPLARPLAFAGTVTDYTDKTAAISAIATQLQAEIDGLRGAGGASVVILLGHGGIAADPAKGDDQLLAEKLQGVDLVLSGHTHRQPDVVLWATDAAGKQVPILQPAPYGLEVARAELVLEPGKATLDTASAVTRFMPVDDTIAPTVDANVLTELDGVVYLLESIPAAIGAGPSFLEKTLTLVETVAHGGVATPVVDDKAVLGDLFYKTIGHTSFEVIGLRPAVVGVQSGETSGLNLDTDAMWAVANGFSSTTTTTQVAVQASGPMRGNLLPGVTGQISFADVYNVVPLGGDPLEGSPGYPLVRFYLSAAELWGAFEFSLLYSTQDPDFYLSPAGLKLAFDRSGTRFNPTTGAGGWITKLTLVDRTGTPEAIFDKSLNPTSGWLINPLTRLVSVVTTLYVAEFARAAGVKPRTSGGVEITDITTTILPISGTAAHWKDHQALAAWVAVLDATYGTLPPIYDETSTAGRVPQRVLCTGPVCP